jgi:hypothetical protein
MTISQCSGPAFEKSKAVIHFTPPVAAVKSDQHEAHTKRDQSRFASAATHQLIGLWPHGMGMVGG